MQSLESIFEQRLASAENHMLLGNLALIVNARSERPIAVSDDALQLSDHYQRVSAYRGMPDSGITIDRSAPLLAAHHQVTIPQLRAFASDGIVLDVGAGESDFLRSFTRSARTIAIDLNEANTAYQASNGHEAFTSPAHDLAPIDSGCIQLLHAAYSAPFWSRTSEEAAQTAHEYLRVLRPGGIALVGPLARSDYHQHYEYVAGIKRYGDRDVLPWEPGENAHISQVWMSFCRTILANQTQGDLSHGFTQLVASRHMEDSRSSRHQIRNSNPETHVPNFVMMRRHA